MDYGINIGVNVQSAQLKSLTRELKELRQIGPLNHLRLIPSLLLLLVFQRVIRRPTYQLFLGELLGQRTNRHSKLFSKKENKKPVVTGFSSSL